MKKIFFSFFVIVSTTMYASTGNKTRKMEKIGDLQITSYSIVRAVSPRKNWNPDISWPTDITPRREKSTATVSTMTKITEE